MALDLPLIWFLIIASGVLVYVVLDGFDLGLGILFPWVRNREHRGVMMRSIAPVWDGNETWLVLGGAALFAAFPRAYAILLSALYVPLSAMLLALVLRGVAFEFRFKAHRWQFVWDGVFAAGSTLATFFQGIMLGAVVQGIPVVDGRYAGGFDGWLTPFSVMTGLGVLASYALLGSGWLIMKTTGGLQELAFRAARQTLVAMLCFVALVSLWTPFAQPAIAARWFSLPNLLHLAPVPLATLIVAAAALWSLHRRAERAPFWLSIALFALSYLGLIVSLWPYIVPRALTLWEAASPPNSQLFVLVGFVIFLPFVLAYTAANYRVFRGKVRDGEGYS